MKEHHTDISSFFTWRFHQPAGSLGGRRSNLYPVITELLSRWVRFGNTSKSNASRLIRVFDGCHHVAMRTEVSTDGAEVVRIAPSPWEKTMTGKEGWGVVWEPAGWEEVVVCVSLSLTWCCICSMWLDGLGEQLHWHQSETCSQVSSSSEPVLASPWTLCCSQAMGNFCLLSMT